MWARGISDLLVVLSAFSVTLDRGSSLGTAKLSARVNQISHTRSKQFTVVVFLYIFSSLSRDGQLYDVLLGGRDFFRVKSHFW